MGPGRRRGSIYDSRSWRARSAPHSRRFCIVLPADAPHSESRPHDEIVSPQATQMAGAAEILKASDGAACKSAVVPVPFSSTTPPSPRAIWSCATPGGHSFGAPPAGRSVGPLIYSKPATTVEAQADLLVARGLALDDRSGTRLRGRDMQPPRRPGLAACRWRRRALRPRPRAFSARPDRLDTGYPARCLRGPCQVPRPRRRGRAARPGTQTARRPRNPGGHAPRRGVDRRARSDACQRCRCVSWPAISAQAKKRGISMR